MSDVVRIPYRGGQITGVPRDLAESRDSTLIQMLEQANTMGLSGDHDFSTVRERLSSSPVGAVLGEGPTVTPEAQRQAELAADTAAVQEADRGNRFRDAWGEVMGFTKEMLDSMTRGAAPATAGAAAGYTIAGLPGAVLGAVSVPLADAVTTGINAIFGTEYTTPSDAVKHWMQDKLGIEPSDSQVLQTLEQATAAWAGSYGFTGVAGNIASAPSAGTLVNSAPGVPVLRGPGGAPIAQSTGRNMAAQMSNLPGINAASAVPSTFVQEGSSNALQNLGLNEGLSETLGFGLGLLTDIGFNMGAEGVVAGLDAMDTPLPDNIRNQVEITDRMTGGMDPLTTDEAIMLNRPTQREASGVARRLGSPGAGTSDTMQRRVYTQQDRTMDWMADQGVELTQYGNPTSLQREHLGGILQSYGEQRGIYLDDLTRARDDVIETLSRPEWPVPVSNTREAIEGIQKELLAQNPTRFSDVSNRLDQTLANLEEGLPLNKVYEELRNIRAEIKDPNLPQGAQRQIDEALTETANALRSDIDRFIVDNGSELQLEQLNAANEGLAGLVQDFNDQSTTELINQLSRSQGRETVETVHSLIRPDAPMNEATAFYDNLTPEGQRMTQQSVYGEILRASIPEGEMLPSPTLINQNTAKYEQWLDIFRNRTKAAPAGDLLDDDGGLIARGVREPYDPQPLDELNRINEFTREVVGVAEQIASGGPKAVQRLGLGANPTAGIALSQAVRKLGIGFGLFMGDVISGSFGSISRAMQRPEVRNLVMAMRSYTPGTERYYDGMQRILRQMYIGEIRGQEAVGQGVEE
jgi:hypothetical protein